MARPITREGYGPHWNAVAAEYKSEHPFCVGCAAIGLHTEATIVDHVIPHKGDEALFWAEENFQAACRWHHLVIKPLLERMWREKKMTDAGLRLNSPEAIKLTKAKHRPAIGVDGLPIAGT